MFSLSVTFIFKQYQLEGEKFKERKKTDKLKWSVSNSYWIMYSVSARNNGLWNANQNT